MSELSTLGSVIKTAYELQADTNAFTDAEKTKLAGLGGGGGGGSESSLPSIMDKGARGDGTLVTLAAAGYATLGAAQAAFPNAGVTSLTQSIDQAAFMECVNLGLTFRMPARTYVFNYACPTITAKDFFVYFEDGAWIVADSGMTSVDGAMIKGINCTSFFSGGLSIDAKHKYRAIFEFANPKFGSGIGSVRSFRAGRSDNTVTSESAHFLLTGIPIHWECTGQTFMYAMKVLNSGGSTYGTYGNGAGSGIFFGVLPSSASSSTDVVNVDIQYMVARGGQASESKAREIDVVNLNTNMRYGTGVTIHGGQFKNHSWFRRIWKLHEGKMTMMNCEVTNEDDFELAAPVGGDPQSDVGISTQEVAGVAGNPTYDTIMTIRNCKIDWTGYPAGAVISGVGTKNRLVIRDSELKGSKKIYSRFNLETSSNQSGNGIGFRDHSNSEAAEVSNTTFYGGMIPVQIIGSNTAIRGCVTDDPIYHWIWVNTVSGETNISVRDIDIYTRTTNALYGGFRCATVQGTDVLSFFKNINFYQAGNTNHDEDILGIADTSAKGRVEGMIVPAACTPNGGASTSVNAVIPTLGSSSMTFTNNNTY